MYRILTCLCLVSTFALAQKKPYDEVSPLSYDVSEVRKGDKIGFMRTSTQKLLTRIEYERYSNVWGFQGNPIGSVGKKGKYALIDANGKEITPFVYDELDLLNCRNNRLVAQQAGKRGILSTAGEVLMPLQYEALYYEFGEQDQIKVQNKGLWGVFDLTTGTEILACQFQNADWQGAQTLIATQTDGKIAVYRATAGKATRLFEPSFDGSLTIDGQTFLMQKDGRWGIASLTNPQPINFLYEEAERGLDQTLSYFKVRKGRLWGLLSASGAVIVSPTFTQSEGYFDKNGLATFLVGKERWLLDTTGKAILKGEYESLQAEPQEGKTVRFRQNGLYGVMGINSREILPAEYQLIGEYEHAWYGLDAFTVLWKDSEVGFANAKGAVFVAPMYQNCGCWYDNMEIGWVLLPSDYFGLMAVQMGNLWGLMDGAGKIILPIEYDRIECPDSDGRGAVGKKGQTAVYNWKNRKLEE